MVALGGNGKAVIERSFIRPEDAPAEAVGAVPQANGATAKTQRAFIRGVAGKLDGTSLRSANRRVDEQQRDVALAAVVHALASQVFYND